MKKVIFALTMLPLLFNVAHGEEAESALAEAPQDFIISQLNNCKQDAVEDEISENEMNNYLITCVNDELEAIEYKKLNTLPTED